MTTIVAWGESETVTKSIEKSILPGWHIVDSVGSWMYIIEPTGQDHDVSEQLAALDRIGGRAVTSL